jgi:hypothetical protein
MSSFKTIKQQNTEKFIEKLFDGLDDPSLKAVFRVMYGLEDETVLDQLRIVNEQNLKDLESALTITDPAVPEEGKVIVEEEPVVPATPNTPEVPPEKGVGGK